MHLTERLLADTNIQLRKDVMRRFHLGHCVDVCVASVQDFLSRCIARRAVYSYNCVR